MGPSSASQRSPSLGTRISGRCARTPLQLGAWILCILLLLLARIIRCLDVRMWYCRCRSLMHLSSRRLGLGPVRRICVVDGYGRRCWSILFNIYWFMRTRGFWCVKICNNAMIKGSVERTESTLIWPGCGWGVTDPLISLLRSSLPNITRIFSNSYTLNLIPLKYNLQCNTSNH